MSINLREEVKTISYLRSSAGEAIEFVTKQKCPIIITQKGEARAVLMDLETYQDTEDAFALMSIIKASEIDLEVGKARRAEDAFNDLRRKITQNG